MDLLKFENRNAIQTHKNASMTWNGDILIVKYDKVNNNTSAGFRYETFLDINQSYSLDISARLVIGEPAFVYIENSDGKRLAPRTKIYNNITFNFVQNFNTDDKLITTFIGILFHHSDQNYEIHIQKFILHTINIPNTSQLTNTYSIQQHNQSISSIPKHATNNYVTDTINIPFDLDTNYDIDNISITTNNTASTTTAINATTTGTVINTTSITADDNNNINEKTNNNELKQHDIDDYIKQSIKQNYEKLFQNNRNGNSISKYKKKIQARNKVLAKHNSDIKTSSTTDNNIYRNIIQTDTNSGTDSGTDSTGHINTSDTSNIVESDNYDNNNNNKIYKSSDNIYYTIPNISTKHILDSKIQETLLPPKVTKSLLDNINYLIKQNKLSIVISLTTIPTRLSKIKPVVQSLLNQSISIKYVYLNIPQSYNRNNKTSYLIDKNWYSRFGPKLKIIRSPDYGPLTKLYPVINFTDNNTLIITADDDHIYPKNWAFYLSYLPITKPNFKAIYSFKGYLNNKYVHKSDIPLNLDWIVGEWGTAIYRKFINDDRQMLKQINFSEEARYSDDVLISNHIAKSHVARILLPITDDTNNDIFPIKQDWANSRDSLHKMNPSQNIRYLKTIQSLKEHKYYFINNTGDLVKIINQYNTNNSSNTSNNNEYTNNNNNNNSSSNNNSNNTNISNVEDVDDLSKNSKNVNKYSNNLQNINPNMFTDKKIKYISYINNILQPDIQLLYINQLSKVTSHISLEFPEIDLTNLSLPSDYKHYYNKILNDIDFIIIDVPFFITDHLFKIDYRLKPIMFICRYPQIGSLEKSKTIIVNIDKPYFGGNFYWAPTLDLQVKPNPNKWNSNMTHFVTIFSNVYYYNNIDLLMTFWNQYGQNMNIMLHIGIIQPYAEQFKKIINQLNLSNIRVYDQSFIFGTLIYYADYYFNLSYYNDLYAQWAYENHKKIITIKYAYFSRANMINVTHIPFKLNNTTLCKEYLLESHHKCHNGTNRCVIYGDTDICVNTIPSIDISELNNIISKVISKI